MLFIYKYYWSGVHFSSSKAKLIKLALNDKGHLKDKYQKNIKMTTAVNSIVMRNGASQHFSER